jgi:predicted transcriptional regulator
MNRETREILNDPETMAGIAAGMADLEAGRVVDLDECLDGGNEVLVVPERIIEQKEETI